MQLAVLILAGGRSQRMGQDKALLEIGGVSLLRQTWNVANTLTPDVWIMTPYRDRYQPQLPSEAQWIDEPLPSGAASPAGPLVAFSHALPQMAADWILLLACDLPNIEREPLQQWVKVLPELSAETIAYVPKTPQGWEPLLGFYRRSCLISLQTYLATGQRSFQAWLEQSPVEVIPDVSVELLANCNTPADWQRFVQDS